MMSKKMSNSQYTIVCGIDECGYGPILGPLVVASSIFLVKENPEQCMWDRLRKSTGKFKKGLENRILVADSKKAFDQASGLGHLERTTKAFLSQLRMGKETFVSLLPIVSLDMEAQVTKYPWYTSLYGYHLPEVNQEALELLTQNLQREEIEFVDFRCCCIDSIEFNNMVRSTENKADVVIDSVLKLIRQIISIASFCAVKKIMIFSDRLGGRMYYEEMLKFLSGFRVIHKEESSRISKYTLSSDKLDLGIQFEVNADSKRFPVALASMVGKYVREQIMKHMNEYFMRLQPELRPTAGYWTDGHRFLKDLSDETLVKAGFERKDLIRVR